MDEESYSVYIQLYFGFVEKFNFAKLLMAGSEIIHGISIIKCDRSPACHS